MTKQELIEAIYTSFKGVALKDGVGLFEADCIDEYMDKNSTVYINWKQKDERENWENLLPIFLSKRYHERVHSSNWFFMDAKGKKFHLPCYLLQDLDEELNGNNPLITTLENYLNDLVLLDSLQQQTLINFFDYKLEVLLKEDNTFDFDKYFNAKTVFIKSIYKNL